MKLSKKEASALLKYLRDKRMAFCFYNGALVSREDCKYILGQTLEGDLRNLLCEEALMA